MNPKLVNPDRFVYSANNAPQPNDSVRYPGHFYAEYLATTFCSASSPKTRT